MVTQTREMTKEVFLSLSDDTKVKMHNHQFLVKEDEWNEVFNWIIQNLSDPYYFEIEHSNTSPSKTRRWILLYNVEDATAFKLKWI